MTNERHFAYAAVALVAEGHALVGDRWERRFREVTLSVHEDLWAADAEVRAFVARSGPRGLQWNGAFVRKVEVS